MKTNLNNQSGFTLIEMILVVSIVGMLAAAIAPSFTTILADSGQMSARGTIGSVQSAVNTIIAQNIAAGCTNYTAGTGCPSGATGVNVSTLASLDSGTAGTSCNSVTGGCFSTVSSTPLFLSSWSKNATGYTYTVSGGGSLAYTYTTTANRAVFTCAQTAPAVCN